MTDANYRSKESLERYARKLELVLVAYLGKRQLQRDLEGADSSYRAALVLTEAELQGARGRLGFVPTYTAAGEKAIAVSLEQSQLEVAPAVPMNAATREAVLDIAEHLGRAKPE